MAYTLTYSESAKGWPSFYSFEPEMMIGMNNRFYSFSGGDLYLHNSENVPRNNFYGNQSTSSITGFINDAPDTVKTFKTIVLDSNSPWKCTVSSDLGSGKIESSWFTLKEGSYYGHIRRNDDDGVLELRSAQGIGNVSSVDSSTPTATVLTFAFELGSMLSIGDKVYKESSGSVSLVGNVTAVDTTAKTITVDITNGSAPSVDQFLMYIKNNVAESYGTAGYYLKYVLENTSTDFAEIFSIGTNVFKSFP